MAPKVLLKKPCAQGVQAEAEARPVAEDQDPAGQGTQAPPCPALLHVPCGQGKQEEGLVAPEIAENVPALQGVQEKGEVAEDVVP